MATFVRGDVVVVPFPFSDLSSSKRRPALVLAQFPGNDLVLCQITSQFAKDASAVALADTDFVSGTLRADSFIRPNKLFTADQDIVAYKVGAVSLAKQQDVFNELIMLFRP
jgi:mRNA interferase MazF